MINWMNINLLDDTDAFYISVVFILKKKRVGGLKLCMIMMTCIICTAHFEM